MKMDKAISPGRHGLGVNNDEGRQKVAIARDSEG
jgi:hypothetical protein